MAEKTNSDKMGIKYMGTGKVRVVSAEIDPPICHLLSTHFRKETHSLKDALAYVWLKAVNFNHDKLF